MKVLGLKLIQNITEFFISLNGVSPQFGKWHKDFR